MNAQLAPLTANPQGMSEIQININSWLYRLCISYNNDNYYYSKQSETAGKEPAHYHSIGPDASKPGRSSHIYTGEPLRSDVHQHDMASFERMDSERCVYENTDAEVRYLLYTILHQLLL